VWEAEVLAPNGGEDVRARDACCVVDVVGARTAIHA
jgi:hypothetical protein